MQLDPRLTFILALLFVSIFLLVRFGWPWLRVWLWRQERYYDRVLNFQLLMSVSPRMAMIVTGVAVLFVASIGYMLGGLEWGVPFGIVAFLLPLLVLRHMDQKRREKLEQQLVDGITTIASGVRAGLTLVQAIELLVRNHSGPIKQEFSQLMREYQMGLDLNQAMRNAANRIGLRNYRLLFTAVEMHRVRGGNTGESLDRIAESIREIQRLEGKLDALTAQGRFQAWMIALSPFFLLGIFYMLDKEAVSLLFTEPVGRIILLIAGLLILGGYLWIRKIMAIDI